MPGNVCCYSDAANALCTKATLQIDTGSWYPCIPANMWSLCALSQNPLLFGPYKKGQMSGIGTRADSTHAAPISGFSHKAPINQTLSLATCAICQVGTCYELHKKRRARPNVTSFKFQHQGSKWNTRVIDLWNSKKIIWHSRKNFIYKNFFWAPFLDLQKQKSNYLYEMKLMDKGDQEFGWRGARDKRKARNNNWG